MQTMRLSEAIRLGAMLKPQGGGCESIRSITHSCALGAALDAVGVEMRYRSGNGAYERVVELWPWLDRITATPRGPVRALTAIYEMNDDGWTREAIADWVATIDAQQEQVEIPAPALVAVEG